MFIAADNVKSKGLLKTGLILRILGSECRLPTDSEVFETAGRPQHQIRLRTRVGDNNLARWLKD